MLNKPKYELMEEFEASYRDAHGHDCPTEQYGEFFDEYLQMKEEGIL